MSESVPAGSPGIGRQMAIYLEGRAGNLPDQPVAIEDLAEKARSILKPAGLTTIWPAAPARRTRCGPTGRPLIAGGSCRDSCAMSLPRSDRRDPRAETARAGHAGADRRSRNLSSRGRASRRAGSRVAWASVHLELGVVADDGRSRRRHAAGEPLVPALLAPERRAGRELSASGRAGGIPGRR